MSRLQTRQAQLPPSLRSLTLSTKPERMKAYSQRGSPVSANQAYSPFAMPISASPHTPSTTNDDVEFTSLPPPPRRTRAIQVSGPGYAPEKDSREVPKLTVKTFRRQSAMSLDEAVLEESPTMAWLQREEQADDRMSRGSIFGQIQPITITEEGEPKMEADATAETAAKTEEEGEKRVSAALAAAKAALEEAAAAVADSSSSKVASDANPEQESVRPESSLEGIHVAEIQYFRTSKPRIISAVSSPTSAHEEKNNSPTRSPVDGGNPLQSEGSTATADDAITLPVCTSTAQSTHHRTGLHPDSSSATLPLRIDKRPRKASERSTVSLPAPKAISSAPPGQRFIVPKGTIIHPSKESPKHRTRGKLVKSRSAIGESRMVLERLY